MADNLQRYVPEFDESEVRAKLAGLSSKELTDLLVTSYMEKRVIAKYSGELSGKLQKIQDLLEQPSELMSMPGVPGPDDLRRMFE